MDRLDANLEVLRRAVQRKVAESSGAADVSAVSAPDSIDTTVIDPPVEWQPTGWLARLFGGRT